MANVTAAANAVFQNVTPNDIWCEHILGLAFRMYEYLVPEAFGGSVLFHIDAFQITFDHSIFHRLR